MPFEFFFILLLFVAWSPSSGQSGGLCISPGGRFHPFTTEGKPPRKVTKGPRDLALCRVFRQRTCCDVVQTLHALELIRRLASFGEGSQDCLHLWELLECSVCDPHIGVQPGPPLICSSFCDMIFKDCSSAYFSIDPRIKVLSPCGLGDVVCGRVSEWVPNGTELCRLAGFFVKQDSISNQGFDDKYCYGGKQSLESVSGSWKASRTSVSDKDQSYYGVFEDIQQWFWRMKVSDKVRWAFVVMILASGLLYVSKRKSYSQRQKRAAVLRVARKVEARISHQPSSISK